jgi:hypothetical protein
MRGTVTGAGKSPARSPTTSRAHKRSGRVGDTGSADYSESGARARCPALIDSRPASEEGSCMDPTRLPHAPHPVTPDSQTACGTTQ